MTTSTWLVSFVQSLAQDTMVVKTQISGNPIAVALTTQQILITIWTIGTVIMIPLVVLLIKVLYMLYKSSERTSALVIGINDADGSPLRSGILGDTRSHERRISNIEHTLANWMVIWKNGSTDTPEEFMQRVSELDWKESPRFRGDTR